MHKIKKVHPNSRENKISEFSNNMQFYVKGLETKKTEIEELENKEIDLLEERVTPSNNIEDDSDAPSI